jgi:tRNA pseudouridine38-40 synthase
LGQVCAFSSRMTVPVERLPVAVNSLLPADIAVLSAERVASDFDPRRASSKTYCYRIWRSRLPSPFWRDRALHLSQRLDLEACRVSLKALIGEHDFAAFRDSGSSAKTTVRKISRAELETRPLAPDWPGEGEFISIWFSGTGFLYHMVRIIIGTLIEVGQGRLSPLVVAQALLSGKRVALGPTAPAQGLWLESVSYAREKSSDDLEEKD